VIRKWLLALAPRDLLIPRKMLAICYVLAFALLTASTSIGFMAGYLLVSDRHADERSITLSEYARQLSIKDQQIDALTDRVIEMQIAAADGATRRDEVIFGIVTVIEELAKSIAGNKANTRQLNRAADALRKLRQAPRQTPPAPPAPRPKIGPPPPSPPMPTPTAPGVTDLYRG
jgi:hypothetical protein